MAVAIPIAAEGITAALEAASTYGTIAAVGADAAGLTGADILGGLINGYVGVAAATSAIGAAGAGVGSLYGSVVTGGRKRARVEYGSERVQITDVLNAVQAHGRFTKIGNGLRFKKKTLRFTPKTSRYSAKSSRFS